MNENEEIIRAIAYHFNIAREQQGRWARKFTVRVAETLSSKEYCVVITYKNRRIHISLGNDKLAYTSIMKVTCWRKIKRGATNEELVGTTEIDLVNPNAFDILDEWIKKVLRKRNKTSIFRVELTKQ